VLLAEHGHDVLARLRRQNRFENAIPEKMLMLVFHPVLPE
jgi:hypothetical protein